MERVYYHIEKQGEDALQELIAEYRKTINGVLAILDHELTNVQGI